MVEWWDGWMVGCWGAGVLGCHEAVLGAVVVAVAEVVALAELWLWWLAVLRRRLLVRVCDGDGALHGAPRGRFRRGSGVGLPAEGSCSSAWSRACRA